MKYLRNALLMFLLPGLLPFTVSAQGFVHTRGKMVLGPDGKELHLKGIGLGNWLVQEGYMWEFGNNCAAPHEIKNLVMELIGPDAARSFWEQYYNRYITREDIAFLQRAGFNSVRVPLNYRLLNPDDAPGSFTGRGWKALDDLIGWCREYHLYVIIDMHCAPGGQTGSNIDDSYGYPFLYETSASRERFIRLWVRIAEKYKNDPAVLGYDLLNEPVPRRSYYDRLMPMLEPLYKEAVAAIRKVDPRHLIILEGPNWDSNFDAFHRPFDPKLVYEFHYYWAPPTIQGIQKFVNFRDKYDVPIWLGESGENTDAWVKQFREVLDSANIGWCFWTYKKMNSTRGVVSFSPPSHWDKVIRYAGACGGVELKEKNHVRDSLSVPGSQEILKDYLDKITFKNCTVNTGFLQALGMKANY